MKHSTYSEHREELKRRGIRDVDVERRHNEEFPFWFASKVSAFIYTQTQYMFLGFHNLN